MYLVADLACPLFLDNANVLQAIVMLHTDRSLHQKEKRWVPPPAVKPRNVSWSAATDIADQATKNAVAPLSRLGHTCSDE